MLIHCLQETIKRAFKEINFLDYAIYNPDEYGDCNTCINDALIDEFGIDSHGIYARLWFKGMNKVKTDTVNEISICHDCLTENEYNQVIKILEKYFKKVEPKTMDITKAIMVSDMIHG